MTTPDSPPSPYSAATKQSKVEQHTLSVLVDNEPGVLARVVGLFSGRAYNIESLTVAEVAHAEHRSRITIRTSGAPETIARGIAAFVERTQADELMIASSIYDHEARKRSQTLTAEVMRGLTT